MKIAYLDCNAGISGNMFVGALIDAGLSVDYLKKELSKMNISLPELVVENVTKQGIAATYFDVPHIHEHNHRHLSDIINIICSAGYSKTIESNAIQCFKELAVSEAKIHKVSVEEIHFHEVGAIDAIIDIVGACIGIDYFKLDKILCSAIRVGFGTVKCAHGEIPLPAPAAAELLNGFEIFSGELSGEWTTPTGAAILKTLSQGNSKLPKMVQEKIGYGAGKADRTIPNVLRIFFGQNNTSATVDTDKLIVIETNIDNMNPEIYGYLSARLFEAGARDVFYTPIYMKKGRPGVLLSVLGTVDIVNKLEEILFLETTTLGVRKYEVERSCLQRSGFIINIGPANVRVKTGIYQGEIVKFAPEYEDCIAAAKLLGKSLKDIYAEINSLAREQLKQKGDN